MLFNIAGGRKIDMERSHRFSEIVEDVYANPFANVKKLENADEIKTYIRGKIRKLKAKLGG